ncbi:c-type cytochrome [Paenibacillus roseipurpureus]|uniref:Cytochrome c n=1 Tax=Paenibacillus roseopurpureus TaxID=2918901 RepID=A0AA96RLQ8_9BACL|nr:cytochrome c [Paenibacillus sp. MBLB1832]WNR45935.1 cytochrome c [Paenibacillus sp. MBLB1832]
MLNKWIQATLCGMLLFAASGCSGKEASPAASTPAAATSTPSAAATATAAPTPQVSATTAPAATALPAATASPAAASATPQPQASATPSPKPTPTPAPASATPAPTPTPAVSVKPQETAVSSNAKAELLYKNNCLVCHGEGLAGDYGPDLTKVGARKTKEQIVNQIMNGRVEMPPFKDKLKPEDIDALANWLASKK